MRTNLLLGYKFTKSPSTKEQLIKTFIDKKIAESGGRLQDQEFTDVRDLVNNEKGLKHYYVCRPVIEIAKKIKLKGEADFSFLTPIPNGKRQWSWDNTFFRWNKTKENIFVFAATIDEKNYLKFTFIRFSLLLEFVVKDDT